MSFLAPIFLLGAVAVGLPVLFHLVRRSSKEQIPFSSLMFLQPTPPRVTRRNRLEHVLLLLLRCLVICLLALGFARPFFQKPLVALPAAQAGRKLLLLLDTSASMRRDGLWAASLAKADAVLRRTSLADQVAVFTFDGQVHSVVNFEQWAAMAPSERADLTAKRLAEQKPGWAATHLGNALMAAAEALAESDKLEPNAATRQIVLISDLQDGSRLDGLQGYDWPRGIEVQVEPVRATRPTNAGLQWITESDDSLKTDAGDGPRLRVSNSADARRERFQLTWAGVGGGAPQEVYVPPGQSRIVSAPKRPAGAAAERVVLSGDDEDFDNTIFVIPPKAEQVTVRFVGDDPTDDPAQPLYYLRRAFQQTPRQTVVLRPQATSAALPPNPAEARLLVLSERLPAAQAAEAQQYLAEGGTVLAVMKHPAVADTIGRLAGADGLSAEDIIATNYAMLGQIDFQHPLFAPFADPRYNDFTKIHFWKHRRLDAGRIPGARVLARFDDGDAALIEVPRGAGRLLVLTSGWQPGDSQLALSSKFVPLLYGILQLSGAVKPQLLQVQVGDAVDVAGGMRSGNVEPVTVRKPDGTTVQLAPGAGRFSQTDTPGIYTVTSAQPPIRFAVNLDPAESRTAPLPVDELQRLGVPLKPSEPAPAARLEQKRRLHDAELEDQQKLWRGLLVATVLLLLGETWLAGWLTRRAPVHTEAVT